MIAHARFNILVPLACVIALLWSRYAAADSHAKPADPLATAHLAQMFLALALVLVVIVGLAWFVKRFYRGPMMHGKQLSVLASLALGPRERVVLVRVGDRQVLLGVTANSIASLTPLDAPIDLSEAQAGAVETGNGFAKHLRRAMGNKS